MIGRKAIAGLCLLCALAFSAIAAQGAAAASKGTTAFTCVKGAGAQELRGAHCLTTGSAPKEYGHVEIKEGTTTEITYTNANTAAETTASTPVRYHITLSGIEAEITAITVSGKGSLTNKKEEPTKEEEEKGVVKGEHYVHGIGTMTFSGMSMPKPAPGGIIVCKVKQAEITTKELKATTTGQGDNLKFEPASGTTFAEFDVESVAGQICPEAIVGKYVVSGSVKSQPVEGMSATGQFSRTATTAEGTLKTRAKTVGIESLRTITGKDPTIEGDGYKPISVTTIETP